MVKGPHCYSFFEGNEAFHKRSADEFTAFYLTDFLVRQFDAFVWRPLGLDRHPELGNNAVAARALGLGELAPFGDLGDSGELVFPSNDPDEPQITVVVTVTVLDADPAFQVALCRLEGISRRAARTVVERADELL